MFDTQTLQGDFVIEGCLPRAATAAAVDEAGESVMMSGNGEVQGVCIAAAWKYQR